MARLPATRLSCANWKRSSSEVISPSAAVQLTDDLEYCFLALFGGDMRVEQSAYAQMSLGAQLLGDEGIGGLLYAIVQQTGRNASEWTISSW